jgi:hypothetical protein
VWQSTVDGEALHFHLAGINNQNFLMKDEQTGSWWQQVSGKAIHGPLKGKQLQGILHDEVTFATWKREHPETRVLSPDPEFAARYEPANWEEEIARLPLATPRPASDPLRSRDLIFGVVGPDGSERAYPFALLADGTPINDDLGGQAILLVPFEEAKSIRLFDRSVAGRNLEFFAGTGEDAGKLVDAETGTLWDTTGLAISGPLSGTRLAPRYGLVDYWFDWKNYHPDTEVYQAGLSR